MVSELESEITQDKYNQSQVSDINLDNGSVSGDMGIEDYAVTELYSDFILCEMLDMSKGFTIVGGIKVPDTKVKSWRRAKVVMISPLCEKYGSTKVGDIVTFPNDKGLNVGRTSYAVNGEVFTMENGVFLNERRLFAKLHELEDAEDEEDKK